jgi:hypothetical protein
MTILSAAILDDPREDLARLAGILAPLARPVICKTPARQSPSPRIPHGPGRRPASGLSGLVSGSAGRAIGIGRTREPAVTEPAAEAKPAVTPRRIRCTDR